MLNRLLAASQMSQKTFSRLAGVSESYVSQICQGKKIPTVAMLLRFARCLNVPVRLFFEEVDGLAAEGENSDLLERYCSLSPERRDELERWIRRRAAEWMMQHMDDNQMTG